MEPVGNMIVDIGGGTTEVAVISLGGIVTRQSVRIAGDDMNEAIINYMKRTYNLLIGEPSAEAVKIEIGSAAPLEKELTRPVKGRDLIAGIPRSATITSEEVREALSEPIQVILDAVKRTLETTDPELSADLIDRGMIIALITRRLSDIKSRRVAKTATLRCYFGGGTACLRCAGVTASHRESPVALYPFGRVSQSGRVIPLRS